MHTTKPTNSLKCVYKQRKDATWLGNEPQSSFAFLPEWIFHYILWKPFKKNPKPSKRHISQTPCLLDRSWHYLASSFCMGSSSSLPSVDKVCKVPLRSPQMHVIAARLGRLWQLCFPGDHSCMDGWVLPQQPTTKTVHGLLPHYSAKAICTTWKARAQKLKTDQSKHCC